MKQKGFTLVELIAVLVVLGLIGLIAVPTVNSSLKKYKQSLYNDAIKNIEQAAKNWGADNIGKLPNASVEESSVTMSYPDIDVEQKFSTLQIRVRDLQEKGYIGSEIKNPTKGSNFCNCAIVTITKTNTGYTYQILADDNGIKLLEVDTNGCFC